jgi:hypothetical protein
MDVRPGDEEVVVRHAHVHPPGHELLTVNGDRGS